MSDNKRFAKLAKLNLTNREHAALEALAAVYGERAADFHYPCRLDKYRPGVFGEKTVTRLVEAGLIEAGPDFERPHLVGYRISAAGQEFLEMKEAL